MPEYEQYKQSEEFAALSKSETKDDDDDDNKKDMDPQGFEKYQEMLDNKLDFSPFVDRVARLNPHSAHLQAMSLRYFLLKGNLQFALDCAERMRDSDEHNAKLWTAVSRLQKLTAEQKKASLKTDAAVATFDEKLDNLTKASDKVGATI